MTDMSEKVEPPVRRSRARSVCALRPARGVALLLFPRRRDPSRTQPAGLLPPEIIGMNSSPKSADIPESPRQEPRLPPGQILTDKWPVLHHGPVPRVDLAKWDFKVFGLVEHPARWTHEEFRSLSRIRVRSDIHCVTRW